MFENKRRVRRVLAGIAGVNLCLAVAVSAGAVPMPGGDEEGPVGSSSTRRSRRSARPRTGPMLPMGMRRRRLIWA